MSDNYSWNGVIGELSKKHADIGLTDFSVTDKRSQVVDFTIPLTYDAAKLWQKIPNRSFSWFTFTNVFENQYWLFLGKNTADQESRYKKLALSSKQSQCMKVGHGRLYRWTENSFPFLLFLKPVEISKKMF